MSEGDMCYAKTGVARNSSTNTWLEKTVACKPTRKVCEPTTGLELCGVHVLQVYESWAIDLRH